MLMMHNPGWAIAQDDTKIENVSPDQEEKEKEQKKEQSEANSAPQNSVQQASAAPAPAPAPAAELTPAPAPVTEPTPDPTPEPASVSNDVPSQGAETASGSSAETTSSQALAETASPGAESASAAAENTAASNAGQDAPGDAASEGGTEETAGKAAISENGTEDETTGAETGNENSTVDEQEESAENEDLLKEKNEAGDGTQTEEDSISSEKPAEDTAEAQNTAEETAPDNQTGEEKTADDKKTEEKEEKKTVQFNLLTASRDAASDQAKVNTASADITWEDDDDINDIRPGFMLVTLQRSVDGGETYEDVEGYVEYRLSAENDWKVVVEDLESEKDGQEILYRWVWDIDQTLEGNPNLTEDSDENNLVGYVRTQNDVSDDGASAKRTYTHVTQKRKYTLSVNWDDCGDKTAEIPDEIEIKLPVEITLPDGTKTDTVTLKKSENWTLSIDLPIMHRDLDWTLSAVDGWVSGGSSTDYNDDATEITFNRRWATEEVQTAAGTSTLKVQYWIGSNEAAPMFVGVYENGQTYNVSVPRITGYRAQVSRVRGTINGNTIINVRYVPNTYTVTVYYRYLNGQTAAPTAYRSVKTGTGYTIGSPAIGGYVANVASISGTVTGRDLTYVVYYTGTGAGGSENVEVVNLNEIDDYKTPLGLGEVGINAGECFE